METIFIIGLSVFILILGIILFLFDILIRSNPEADKEVEIKEKERQDFKDPSQKIKCDWKRCRVHDYPENFHQLTIKDKIVFFCNRHFEAYNKMKTYDIPKNKIKNKDKYDITSRAH